MTHVKCTVNRCDYWGEGQVCNADEIVVKNDTSGGSGNHFHSYLNDAMEIGDELGERHEHRSMNEDKIARTSAQTCCDTMKPKQEELGRQEVQMKGKSGVPMDEP